MSLTHLVIRNTQLISSSFNVFNFISNRSTAGCIFAHKSLITYKQAEIEDNEEQLYF
jgi:hypothetical protein